jgi:hypothetical protein
MESRENPHMVKYKAITNDWNYDASCTLTSLTVWDLENFKRLVFVVQSVRGHQNFGETYRLHFQAEEVNGCTFLRNF